MAESESSNRYSTFIAVLIALVSIAGAVIAWRVAVASSVAGSADTVGLLAAVDRQDVTTQASITVTGHFTAYVAYVRNNALADAYSALADVLPAQRTQLNDLSSAAGLAANYALDYVPHAYLDRAGQLNRTRELGEQIADLAVNKDINPDPYFTQADLARNKSQWLLLNLIVLGISLLMLTLSDAIRNPLRYVLLLGGLGTFLIGTVSALLIDLLGAPLINIIITL